MEEKRALEEFRLRQYAGPHPARVISGVNPSTTPPAQIQPQQELPLNHHPSPPLPDSTRVILHFDADCFYAQCEELQDPSLRERPLGVTQKFLIVTCNYIARGRGVQKLMSIKDAQALCPDLVLINGEDLTPYRHASKNMISVLKRYGTVQKLGLDEIFVDVTATVESRLKNNSKYNISSSDGVGIEWAGHIHVPSEAGELHQDNKYRPMDLRVNSVSTETTDSIASNTNAENSSYKNAPWWPRLAAGSIIARDARHAVKIETGIRTSAGISCNKLLSKLSSGLHKPDDQTLLLPCYAAAFVEPLPVRALPSVGHKLESELIALGIDTVGSLRMKFQDSQHLVQKFGERVGIFLSLARWGKDNSEVIEQGPPKSITVEDSFKSCRGYPAVQQVLTVLAPDLIARLKEESEENNRRPSKLIVKWRVKGQGWNRTSASCVFPVAALTQPEELKKVAGQLLAANVKEPFDLTLISIGGTHFVDTAGVGTGRSIADMLMLQHTGNESGHGARVPQQPERQEQQQQEPLSSPAAVAGLSLKRRRDYGTGSDQVPLSKHAERILRQGGAGGGTAGGSRGDAVDFNIYKEEDNGNEDEDMMDLWSDLAGLHDRSHRKQQQQQRVGSRNGNYRPTSAVGVRASNADALLSTAAAADIATGSGRLCKQRVVIHCDIDSFYCSVERLDDPSLRNVPLAVEQFNSGGFVAVSYEARAAGIRCGDGAGAAGRAVIPHLAAMNARSVEECRVACPGLIVRGMRPQRYREVGRAVHEMLKNLVGNEIAVEKASCDDFYLDITTLCSVGNGSVDTSAIEGLPSLTTIEESPPEGLKFINEENNGKDEENRTSGSLWSTIASDLQRGVWIAHQIRRVLHQNLGLTASCAVSRNKLISRLASPVNKPNGLTLVPTVTAAIRFIGNIPINRVPSLQAKFGAEVQETLNIQLVKDLVNFEKKDLETKFGPSRGKFLSEIPYAIDDTPVAERGPPKSITSERSFPFCRNQEAVLIVLKPLVEQLLLRGAEDFAEHSRLPIKLGVGFRLGYDTNLVSRSAPVPVKLLTWLRASMDSTLFCDGAADALETAVNAVTVLLRGATNGRWDVTRLAVVFHYADTNNNGSRGEQIGPTIGELFQAAPAAATSKNSLEEKVSKIEASQTKAGPSKLQKKHASATGTYRNAEALALQAMFGGGGSGGSGVQNEILVKRDAGESEDDASLELALKLQREEAEAMAASQNRFRNQSSNGSKPKKRGPLDSFFGAKPKMKK